MGALPASNRCNGKCSPRAGKCNGFIPRSRPLKLRFLGRIECRCRIPLVYAYSYSVHRTPRRTVLALEETQSSTRTTAIAFRASTIEAETTQLQDSRFQAFRKS